MLSTLRNISYNILTIKKLTLFFQNVIRACIFILITFQLILQVFYFNNRYDSDRFVEVRKEKELYQTFLSIHMCSIRQQALDRATRSHRSRIIL